MLSLGRNQARDLSDQDVAHDRCPAVGMLNRPVNQDGRRRAVMTFGYEGSGLEVY